jgi:hypothetical protein
MIKEGNCYYAFIENIPSNIINPVYIYVSRYVPIFDPVLEKDNHAFICDIYDSNGHLHMNIHILESNISYPIKLSHKNCKDIFFEDITKKYFDSMESYEYS